MRLMFDGKEYFAPLPMAGDGLSKDGNMLNVDNPIRGILTQAEFSALTEEQKASGTYLVDNGEGGSSGWETYSTEERRVGTWIDGKPLYRKVFYDNSTRIPELNGVLIAENVDFLVDQYGVLIEVNPEKTILSREGFPYGNIKEAVSTQLNSDNDLRFYVTGDWSSFTLNAIFEYTKTTDQGVNQ